MSKTMGQLTLVERREILFDYQLIGSKATKEKWGINSNTLHHIRFYHGQSSAKARGYYSKDLLQGLKHPIIAKIKSLKQEGLGSLEVAKKLGVSLEVVNKNWV